jgi:hypothetical protein
MDMIEYTIQLFLNDLCLLYELDIEKISRFLGLNESAQRGF